MKIAMIHIEANFGSEHEKYSIVVIILKATGLQYMFVQRNNNLRSDYRQQDCIKDGHSRKKKYETDSESHTTSSALLVDFFFDFLCAFCILSEIAASWKG